MPIVGMLEAMSPHVPLAWSMTRSGQNLIGRAPGAWDAGSVWPRLSVVELPPDSPFESVDEDSARGVRAPSSSAPASSVPATNPAAFSPLVRSGV